MLSIYVTALAPCHPHPWWTLPRSSVVSLSSKHGVAIAVSGLEHCGHQHKTFIKTGSLIFPCGMGKSHKAQEAHGVHKIHETHPLLKGSITSSL